MSKKFFEPAVLLSRKQGTPNQTPQRKRACLECATASTLILGPCALRTFLSSPFRHAKAKKPPYRYTAVRSIEYFNRLADAAEIPANRPTSLMPYRTPTIASPSEPWSWGLEVSQTSLKPHVRLPDHEEYDLAEQGSEIANHSNQGNGCWVSLSLGLTTPNQMPTRGGKS
jgi:hypothetical protein